MKVLFSQSLPFFLAHGGTQTFIQSVMRELPALGVEVEPERWWDEGQRGDIIHFVGRPAAMHVRLARQKGFKTVLTEFLDQPASRPRWKLMLQRTLIRTGRRCFGEFAGRLSWDVYNEIDALVYAVPHELETARYLFDARASHSFVIPHGLDPSAIAELRQPADESDYLVSVATIAERKNTHLLAAAAKEAQVPVLFIGKSYSEDDSYFERFLRLVDEKYVRYAGFVSEADKYAYLKAARGFALLSQFESGCIAIFEAAAAGLPLFLSKLRWATESYPQARHSVFVDLGNRREIARDLARFYTAAHRLSGPTFPLLTWSEVAGRYRDVYNEIAGRP